MAPCRPSLGSPVPLPSLFAGMDSLQDCGDHGVWYGKQSPRGLSCALHNCPRLLPACNLAFCRLAHCVATVQAMGRSPHPSAVARHSASRKTPPFIQVGCVELGGYVLLQMYMGPNCRPTRSAVELMPSRFLMHPWLVYLCIAATWTMSAWLLHAGLTIRSHVTPSLGVNCICAFAALCSSLP
jgi:hypothetical protein